MKNSHSHLFGLEPLEARLLLSGDGLASALAPSTPPDQNLLASETSEPAATPVPTASTAAGIENVFAATLTADNLAQFGAVIGDTLNIDLSGVSVVVEGQIQLSGNLNLTAANISLAPGASITAPGGSVALQSTGDTLLGAGTSIDVANPQAGGTGGTVILLGKRVGLFGSNIDASGAAGGGTILVGGDYQGEGALANADRTYISSDSTLKADALSAGNGGKVIVWSEQLTRYAGHINAQGAADGGQGGFAEVSSHDQLVFRGTADLSSGGGTIGTLLLDPRNITVQNAGTETDLVGAPDDGNANIYAFTEDPASSVTLDADVLTTILGAGTSVTLQAHNDITISEAVDSSGGATAGGGLTLRAGDDVVINANVKTKNGAIAITADDSGATPVAPDGTGDLTMADGTTIDAGTATVSLSAEGNVTVETITTTNTVTITSSTSSIVRASADSLITGSTVALNAANGADDAVGALASPIRTTATTVQGTAGTGGFFVTETNAIDLGAITVTGGNLVVTATLGNITDTGTATIGGTATFITAASGSSIVLDSASNAFEGSVTMKADTAGNETFNNITFVDSAAVKLDSNADAAGDLFIDAATNGSVAGSLSVTAASGNITQDVGLTITVAANATFTTSAVDADITLTNLAVSGTIGLSTEGGGDTVGADATITNASGINFAESTVEGALTAEAESGAITDNDTVTVKGNATFTATQANADIDLGTLAVTGTIALNTNGATGNATVVNTIDIAIAASTVGGNLAVTATTLDIIDSGTVTVGGNATFTTVEVNRDITLDDLAVSGTIGLTTAGPTGNANVTNASGINFADTTVEGALTAEAESGPITDSGSLTVASGATFTTTDDDINLNNTANDISGTINFEAADDDVTLVNSDDIALGNCTVGGNLSVTVLTGNIITGTTTTGVVVTGTSAFAANEAGASIILSDTDNDFTGTVAFSSTGGLANVTIHDESALDLSALTLTGNLNVEADAITDSGKLIIAGTTTLVSANGDIVLDTTTNNFGDDVIITGAAAVTLVDVNALELGESTIDGDFTLTINGALTQVAATNVDVTGDTVIRVGSGNDITLNEANEFTTLSILTAKNVSVTDDDTLELGTSVISGNLDMTLTAGDLTQTDSTTLTVKGTATFNVLAGDIVLTETKNDLSTLEITDAVNVTIVDATALTFGAVAVTTDLTVTTKGALTQSDAISAGGTTTLNVGTGSTITLDNPNNDFLTLEISAAKNVIIQEVNDLDLGTSVVSGTLSITAADGVTDSDAVTVKGMATFVADSVELDEDNQFSRISITTATGDATVNDLSALILGAFDVAANLVLTAGGHITQQGAVVVGGTTTLEVPNTRNIILKNRLNDFSDADALSITTAKDVTLTDVSGLMLGASTISGKLTLTAGGDVTDDGALEVTGVATFDVGANDLTLDEGGNEFLSKVIVKTAADATLVDATSILLGASLVTGDFSVTAEDGITQNARIIVEGDATFDAATDSDVVLDNTANDFNSVTVSEALNVTLKEKDDLVLNGSVSAISGDLTIIIKGNLTQTGEVTVNGDTTISAKNITLTDADNNFTGSVAILSGQNVALTDTDDIALGMLKKIGGTLNVIATTGAITQSAGAFMKVTGAATFQAGDAITLDNAGNNFSSVAVTSSLSVTLRDSNALVLGTCAINGDLTLTIKGHLTQTTGSAVTVTGTATFSVGSSYDITLTNAGNNFGTITLVAGEYGTATFN